KGASNKSAQGRPSSFIAASLREIEDIVRISVGCYAGYASGLNITGDNVKLIVDHCAGKTMARDAHARKALVPSVRSWVIGLECPESRHDFVVLKFTAADEDSALVNATRDAAARRRHLCLCRPQILGDVVLFVDIGIARARHEGRSQSTANGVDLSV